MTYYDSIITGTSGVTNYYKFESNGNDSVGSSNFTIATGYATSSAGREGNGLSADASTTKTGSYLPGAMVSLFGSTYSIEFWFKMTTAATSQELMRVADYIALEMGTDGKILYYYNGSSGTTASSYGDGAWHHLVITRDSSRLVNVYIDGTSRISFTAPTGSPTSSNFYFLGSQYTTQAVRTGYMDSLSIYNVALSSGTVSAHRTAMGGANYNAEVSTASGVAVSPTLSFTTNAGYTAGPMFGSGDIGVHMGTGNKMMVTEDATTNSSSPTTNYGSATTASGVIFYKLPAPVLPSGEFLTSKTLWVNASSSLGHSVYTVASDWSESTITYSNQPATTFVYQYGFGGGAGWYGIDLTGIDTTYGIAIGSMNGVATSENATVANRPYVVYTSAPTTHVSPSASPMTASGTMPDPVTSTERTVSVSGSPMTASGLMPPATGTGEQFVSITLDAESMDGSAEMPAGSNFTSPVTISAGVMTASGLGVSPSAGTTTGVYYPTPAMNASSRLVKPSLNINGVDVTLAIAEDEDDYFRWVAREGPSQPSRWFRLNDQGSTARDRANANAVSGAYHGVQTGRFDGPDGRHSVYFNGNASLEQTISDPTLNPIGGVVLSALEFSFRTNKANEFIMASGDEITGSNLSQFFGSQAREIVLKNGKITYREHFAGGFNGGIYYPSSPPKEFSGFKNLADGEWHSVVIRGGTYRYLERGVEIWVDGKLEVRRVNANAPLGFPDWVGSRPQSIRGIDYGALPSSQNFVGDMSEIVFYTNDVVDDHEIPRHYYAFMGWKPIEAEPIEAFAFTPAGHKGKGNQKRALYLYWEERQEGYPSEGNFNPLPGPNTDPLGGRYHFNFNTADAFGYKIFMRGIVSAVGVGEAGTARGNAYRDPVTDSIGLIDLNLDVDIDDYDVVMFADWPDTGAEFDRYRSIYPRFDRDYERLLSQLRDVNDKGVGLFITQPRLAIDLGVTDRVEWCESLRESSYSGRAGAANGLYDYGSAYKFPWNIVASDGLENAQTLGAPTNGAPVNRDPVFLANKAYFYEDYNKNNRFRVRATIPGLTDIPSYMIEDMVFHKDYDEWGWEGIARKHLKRMDGLRIGDEYIYWGTEGATDLVERVFTREYGTWATPPGHVKAGTVVTTFGSKQWKSQSEVDNPYKDYATTIVLQPGDSLAGRPVGGRIYVNFSEQAQGQREVVPEQVLPAPGNFPYRYNEDTAEQKQWGYSWTRTSLTTNQTVNSSVVSITLPDGSIADISSSSTGNLSMVRSSQIFPIAWYPSWQMNRRGLWWLGAYEKQQEGDAVVRATPATATASAVQPVVTAQRDVQVSAAPMYALATLERAAEDTAGDVQVRSLPMTAAATFTGFSRVISASPMTATAVLVDTFDMVHTTGEQVVLTVYNAEAQLYLKEDA